MSFTVYRNQISYNKHDALEYCFYSMFFLWPIPHMQQQNIVQNIYYIRLYLPVQIFTCF